MQNSFLSKFYPGFIGLFLCGLLLGCQQQESNHPNIIFILSDDHAAHDIGVYGSKVKHTPNIDKLASEGMVFKSAFVTEAICKPSRSAILTGKYGHITGATGWNTYDTARHKNFPEYLKQAGYQTALFGKYHLGENPPGFDQFAILPGQGRYFNPELIWKDNGRQTHQGHVSDVIGDLSIDWLKNREKDRPFLMCVQFKAAHMPFQPLERLQSKYANQKIPEPATLFLDQKHPEWPASHSALHIDNLMRWMEPYWPEVPSNVSQKEIRRQIYQTYIKDYMRTIEGMDQNIGRLMDYLEENNLQKNTVVVYTSDQGFFLGERGLFDKRFMYEPSARIPVIIRYPKMIQTNSTNRQLVLNIDMAPTLLDFAGMDVPEDMQGRSLHPLLNGKNPENWRDAIYYRLYANDYKVVPHSGIRTKQYKLIHFQGKGVDDHESPAQTPYFDSWQLFDVQNDPGETTNLYNQPEYQETVDHLKNKLDSLRKELKEGINQ